MFDMFLKYKTVKSTTYMTYIFKLLSAMEYILFIKSTFGLLFLAHTLIRHTTYTAIKRQSQNKTRLSANCATDMTVYKILKTNMHFD